MLFCVFLKAIANHRRKAEFLGFMRNLSVASTSYNRMLYIMIYVLANK